MAPWLRIALHGAFAGIISLSTALTATLAQALQDGKSVHEYAVYIAILGAVGSAVKDWSALTTEKPQ